MFTGIIEELGVITTLTKGVDHLCLEIQADKILTDSKIGDSMSVNGCCLTIVDIKANVFTCHAVPETLQKTNLRELTIGAKVNLERSVKLQDRLHGHLVQGHVDATGMIIEKNNLGKEAWWVTIEAPSSVLYYLISKGSITVDGISLTIAQINHTTFSLALIPHTAQVTTLGFKEVGSLVNIEIDMLAKYVEKFLLTTKLPDLHKN